MKNASEGFHIYVMLLAGCTTLFTMVNINAYNSLPPFPSSFWEMAYNWHKASRRVEKFPEPGGSPL